jgi:iron complex outermembrane receptor protein
MPKKVVGFTASALLAAAMASSAHAQIETVTVTAEKRSEDIQSVPIAMHAFTQSDIKNSKIVSVADLTSQVPGLEMGELGGSANISMRGIGLNTLSGDGEGAVAINLDGVYIARTKAADMLQNDLGSVEILEGPQSTLYGKNAIAGVINFSTPAPTDDLEGNVQASYGNYDAYDLQGDVSGPLSDNTRARVFIDHDAHSGYIENLTTGHDVDFLNATGGDVAVDSDLSSALTLEVRAHARQEIFGGPVWDAYDPAHLPLFLPDNAFVLANYVAIDPQKTRGGFPDHSSRGFYGGSVKLTADLGSMDLVATTGFNQFDLDTDTDGTHIDPSAGIAVHAQRYEMSNTVSQELDLRSKDTSKLKWLLGAYFLYEHDQVRSIVSLPGTLVDTIVRSNDFNYSLFADGQYPILDHTRVYAGARIFTESQTFGITNYMNGVSDCSIDAPYKRSATDWAGRFGVQQDISDGVMAYAQYSRGYKSGAFGSADCDNEYKPERNNAFEVGFKSAWLDNRLIANAAYYHYNYSDYQVETNIPTGLLFVNAPHAEVDGAEASVQANPIDRLDLDFGISLLNARYTEFAAQNLQLIAIGLETPGASLAGNPLNHAPHYTIDLGAQYTLPLGADSGDLTLRGEAKFSDKFALTEANVPDTTQPAYTLANFFLTYTDPSDKYTVRAYVKNATDVHVLGGVLSLYGLMGTFGPPRTYGVELSAALH